MKPLQRVRKASGMTVAEVCKITGMTQPTLNRKEEEYWDMTIKEWGRLYNAVGTDSKAMMDELFSGVMAKNFQV